MPPKRSTQIKPSIRPQNKSKGSTSKTSGSSRTNPAMKTPAVLRKKKTPSTYDTAAIKIQCLVRQFVAKRRLFRLQRKKLEYEKMIDEMQKKAYLEMVQKQRKEDEKIRLKNEMECKRRKQEIKWKKEIMEFAFDGELDDLKCLLKQIVSEIRNMSSLSGDVLENMIQRVYQNLIECKDANENSAFSEACAGGHLETVQFFIKNGAGVNSVGQFHRTPLFRAAFGGHIHVVRCLLENGGDPRIIDNDGLSPDQASALPEISELILNWDISQTENCLKFIEQKHAGVKQEQDRIKMLEKERLAVALSELEGEYSTKQKILQKAHEELNKRIYEHDKFAAQGSSKQLTLQSINLAEDELLRARRVESECREKLANLKLQIREQQGEAEEDSRCVKCNIKELDDVIMKDVGGVIARSCKCPLLIDTSSQAVTFLRYRDTNYVNSLNPRDMQADLLRKALLGAIRYGKFLVLDMMEVNMMEFIEARFDEIQHGLLQQVLTKEILQDERYFSLLRDEDVLEEYARDKFLQSRVSKFSLIFVTQMSDPPSGWLDRFYAIKVVTSM